MCRLSPKTGTYPVHGSLGRVCGWQRGASRGGSGGLFGRLKESPQLCDGVQRAKIATVSADLVVQRDLTYACAALQLTQGGELFHAAVAKANLKLSAVRRCSAR